LFGTDDDARSGGRVLRPYA